MKVELEMRCDGVRLFSCETILSDELAARARRSAFDAPVRDWLGVGTAMLADAEEDIGSKSTRESPTCTLAFRLRSEPEIEVE